MEEKRLEEIKSLIDDRRAEILSGSIDYISDFVDGDDFDEAAYQRSAEEGEWAEVVYDCFTDEEVEGGDLGEDEIDTYLNPIYEEAISTLSLEAQIKIRAYFKRFA